MNNETLIILLVFVVIFAITIPIVIGIIYLTVKGVQCAESPIICFFKSIF